MKHKRNVNAQVFNLSNYVVKFVRIRRPSVFFFLFPFFGLETFNIQRPTNAED